MSKAMQVGQRPPISCGTVVAQAQTTKITGTNQKHAKQKNNVFPFQSNKQEKHILGLTVTPLSHKQINLRTSLMGQHRYEQNETGCAAGLLPTVLSVCLGRCKNRDNVLHKLPYGTSIQNVHI